MWQKKWFIVGLFISIIHLSYGWHNWDHSITCPNIPIYAPQTTHTIPLNNGPYLIQGAGHSWNVASCFFKGVILTKHFQSPPRLFKKNGEYIVDTGANITLGDLLIYLEKEGRSLETFPNMPEITIGGAVATASHGTSFQQGTISNSLVSVEVTPFYPPIQLGAYATNIGKLGVISKLQLRTTPLEWLERQVDLIDEGLFFKKWSHFQTDYKRFQAWFYVGFKK